MFAKIEPVPVFRCAYLDLFIRTFEELGLDITPNLRSACLPLKPPECQGEYVPVLPTLAFVATAAKMHGNKDIGYLAGSRIKLSDLNETLRHGLNSATTLNEALQSYCKMANSEHSHVLCNITEQTSGEFRFNATMALGQEPEQASYAEWLLIMSVIAVVRHAAGNDWHPSQINFHSKPSLGKSTWKAFPDTHFVVGLRETCILFPREIAGLPWPKCTNVAKICHTKVSATRPARHYWDFPNSLSAALRPYLTEGYPNINLAARVAGLSVRTLQRRLRQCHLTYSEVIMQLRFDYAKELLQDPKKSVIGTAFAVGYSDPSHFSRAFRQMAGISPTEFRRLRQAA